MRRNPLARDIVAGREGNDAIALVAARVQRAFTEMDAHHRPQRRWQGVRRIAILLRVDLAKHEPLMVASDLGLSLRQFHRERRLAYSHFLSAFRDQTPHRAPATVTDDHATRMLAHAGSLADCGESWSANALLADIAAASSDAAARCEALVRMAEIDAWAHRLDRARIHLDAADASLAASSIPAAKREQLADSRSAVALYLVWFTEGPSAVEPFAVRQRGAAGEPPAHCRTTLVRAAASLRIGESAHAATLLQRVEAAGARGAAPELEVDALTLHAELTDYTADDPLLSEELFARAAALARAHGLGGRELYATHQLALTRWMHSREACDRSAYRLLVDGVDRSLSPRLRSYLAFSAADIELAIGNPRRALRAVDAVAAVSTNVYESLSARGLRAGALLRLGLVGDAGTQAGMAAVVARAEGHPRIVSLAQRISAQAYFMQGKRDAAREAIEEAIECARRFSSAHVFAHAQAVLGRINGRRAADPQTIA